MRNIVIYCCFVFFLGGKVFSQGVLGKKAVVKLSVINGFRTPLNDAQFEYAFGKRFSITAGYSILPYNIKPEYRLSYAYNFLNKSNSATLDEYGYSSLEKEVVSSKQVDYKAYDYFDYQVFNSVPRLQVKSSVWTIGFRKYRNNIFSAPYGNYFSFEFMRGKQLVTGDLKIPIPTAEEFDPFLQYSSYYIQNNRNFKIKDREINTSVIQMNFGKQWVKFDFLTIDFSWGLAYSMTTAKNKIRDAYVASVLARNNGINFGGMPYPKFESGSFPFDYRNASLGMNLNLRIGFLIF